MADRALDLDEGGLGVCLHEQIVRDLEFRLDVAMVALAHAALERHHGDMPAAGVQVDRWIHGARKEAIERMVARMIARLATERAQQLQRPQGETLH